jgi:hypothetical protein
MDEVVDQILADIHTTSHGSGHADNDTNKLLVVLGYMFPGILVDAINLIEANKGRKYCCEEIPSHSVWYIGGCTVNLSCWTCNCPDFIRALCASEVSSTKWRRVCCHLMAARLLIEKYSFFPPSKEPLVLSINDFIRFLFD